MLLNKVVTVYMRGRTGTVGCETSIQLAHPLLLAIDLTLIFFFYNHPVLPEPSIPLLLTLAL
jgi:hypothetical protein